MISDALLFFLFVFGLLLPIGFLINRLLMPTSTVCRIGMYSLFGLIFFTAITFLLGVAGILHYVRGIWIFMPLGLWILIKNIKVDLAYILTLLVVVAITSPVYLPYAYQPPLDLRFFGAHHDDGLNNIALINSLQRSVPPSNPNFSNTHLAHYHYLINLFTAGVQSTTHIPVISLYFSYIPVFLLTILGWLIYDYLKIKLESRFWSSLGAIVAICSSNLFYLVSLVFKPARFQPSNVWADSYSSQLVNYQLLSSYSLLFGFLVLQSAQAAPWLVGLIVAISLGFKVYLWIVLILTTLGMAIFNVYYRKLLFWEALFSLPVYLWFIGISPSQLVVAPLWFIKSMFESPDRINYPIWELQRQTLLQSKSFLGLGKLYGMGLLTFLLVNFGPRITSISASLRKVETWIIAISIVFPLTFIQKSSAWNTIQILFYALVLTSSLYAYSLRKFATEIRLSLFIFGWLVLLPGVIFINNFYNHPPSYVRENSDLVSAAKFMKDLPYGNTLLHTDYANNSLFSALSSKPVYLAEELILSSYGIDTTQRKLDIKSPTLKLLIDNHIRYLVWPKNDLFALPTAKKVFENSQLTIYEYPNS